jgi:hypothetical protein
MSVRSADISFARKTALTSPAPKRILEMASTKSAVCLTGETRIQSAFETVAAPGKPAGDHHLVINFRGNMDSLVQPVK